MIRFTCAPNTHQGGWNIYQLKNDDSTGELVAIVFDRATLKLFLSAPALQQIHADMRRIHPAQGLRSERGYKESAFGSFQEVFMKFFGKIK